MGTSFRDVPRDIEIVEAFLKDAPRNNNDIMDASFRIFLGDPERY